MAVITGTAGADTLAGTADADTIDGGAGDDTISGGVGDDVILGGTGVNILNGDGGADRFVIVEDRLPTTQSVTINGGADRDTVDFSQVSTFPDILTRATYARYLNVDSGPGDSFSANLVTVVTGAIDGTPPRAFSYIAASGSGVEGFLGSTGTDQFRLGAWVKSVAIDGGLGADTLTSGAGSDTLDGGGGNDQLFGGAGADSLGGGEADDFVQGNQGADTISGGEGADTLLGGQNDDRISGDNGDDLIYGDLGNDNISGGEGQDSIVAASGSDTVDGGAGLDVLVVAGNGATLTRDGGATVVTNASTTIRLTDVELIRYDTGYVLSSQLVGTGPAANGTEGADTLRGTINGAVNSGGGDDRIIISTGEAENTLIAGGLGQDTVDFSEARLSFATSLLSRERVIVQGGPENSFVAIIEGQSFRASTPILTPAGPAVFTAVAGGGGVERFIGTRSADIFDLANWTQAVTIEGGSGDFIRTGAGADTITILGESGIVYAGAGADLIRTGDGADFVQGNQGNDTISTGVGADSIEGGQGNDLIDGGDGANVVFGRLGDDTIAVADGQDFVDGGQGNDAIQTRDGNDTILGGDGLDTIDGGAGNDRIEGGADADIVNGGAGNDTLFGGFGADTLTGGAGADAFFTSAFLDSNFDTLTDFQTGIDRLVIGRNNVVYASSSDPSGTLETGLAQARAAFAGAPNVYAYGVPEGVYVFVDLVGGPEPDSIFLLRGITLSGIASGDFVNNA